MLQDRPELDVHLRIPWDTFWVLTSSRVVSGMGGVSGILPSEILVHLQWLGIREHTLQDILFRQVLAMDGVYLKWQSDKAEQRRNTK